jgi:hypothetical protein
MYAIFLYGLEPWSTWSLKIVIVFSTLHGHVIFLYQNIKIVRLLQILSDTTGKVLVIRVQIPQKVHKINTLIEIFTCRQIS